MTEPYATCECGEPLPCELHTVSHDQSVAFAALRRLSVTQRGLVLCWFCPWCHRYLPPGESRGDCETAKCIGKAKAPDGRQ